MNPANELGAFLKARRARVTPARAGLPVLDRRRVAGLRREEVAGLAGVSAVYYTRLEQGRARNPSGAVLDALARALRLDPTERAHLYDLAHRAPAGRRAGGGTAQVPAPDGTGADVRAGAGEEVRVREGLRRLLAAVGAVPAYVLDPAMTVLAANPLGHALLGGPPARPAEDPSGGPAGGQTEDAFGGAVSGQAGRPADGQADGPARGGPAGGPSREADRRPPLNLARHVFLDGDARALYPSWADVARQTVAFLRLSAGRRPGDAGPARIVAELSRRSEDFRHLWAAQEVREKSYGVKRFRHPVVGTFDLTYETLTLPGDEGWSLVVFTAPDGRADAALRLLGSWTAEYRAERAADPPGRPPGRSGPRVESES
ncbi:helix-turn-helix transcriptional regulator [Streptomyces fradiae]|uniref:helix-turn-helix transcriptional regulator n=1 Tax=Streptomyces fradiae TaxID=1906 RepID=UPI0039858CAE